MYETSFQRPKNYFNLSSKEQWKIDEKLGILDWKGGNLTTAEKLRFNEHYKK